MKWNMKKWSERSIIGCLLAAVLMFGVVYCPAAVSVAGTSRQLPIYCVQRDQKVLSISFDAAWGDARVRHIRDWFAANLIRRKLYHKNSPCYGRGSSITRRFRYRVGEKSGYFEKILSD